MRNQEMIGYSRKGGAMGNNNSGLTMSLGTAGLSGFSSSVSNASYAPYGNAQHSYMSIGRGVVGGVPSQVFSVVTGMNEPPLREHIPLSLVKVNWSADHVQSGSGGSYPQYIGDYNVAHRIRDDGGYSNAGSSLQPSAPSRKHRPTPAPTMQIAKAIDGFRRVPVLGQPPHTNRVNVSASTDRKKKALRPYLVRARRILRLTNDCVICGMGQAVPVVAEVVEQLKRERVAIVASFVYMYFFPFENLINFFFFLPLLSMISLTYTCLFFLCSHGSGKNCILCIYLHMLHTIGVETDLSEFDSELEEHRPIIEVFLFFKFFFCVHFNCLCDDHFRDKKLVSDFRRRKVIEIFELHDNESVGALSIAIIEKVSSYK
ncbi:hypothetical protein RFI_08589 [Reticulomyxa filosa]|uniref:DNA/RNA-binding protein Alba-like domain-containing protein n=1 Tax=Reticulomyxa filosa TaxID=46433 RepID=X6NS42_RETFI|nr:hypothetical protein RFI_08589 [Reticulomyxa filosa]|eukprot:ETO28539.1 hypothetical protein RFI_08589 [Reticulomyxa filosa]